MGVDRRSSRRPRRAAAGDRRVRATQCHPPPRSSQIARMPVDRYAEIHARVPVGRARTISTSPTRAAAAGRPTARASRCTGRTSPARAASHTFWDLAARGQPPVANALPRTGRGARRQGRAHPAAAAARRPSRTSRSTRWARSPCRCRSCSAPMRSSTASHDSRGEGRDRRSAVAAESRADRARNCPRLAHVDRRRRRARGDGIVACDERSSPARRRDFTARRDARRRPRASRLHERHDRAAQGRADAAPRACIGNLPGFVAFAQRLSAAGRPVLVARRLGVDRRTDGRAAADALLRPADRRLSRPLRSRARVRADARNTRSATRSCSRPR